MSNLLLPGLDPYLEKIFSKVTEAFSDLCGTNCMLWGKNPEQYGRIWIGGEIWAIHRVVYTACVGEIPFGYVIDHLCRRPACCNPFHLEAVTDSENVQRGLRGRLRQHPTHCPHGHERATTGYVYYCKVCRKLKTKGEVATKERTHCPAGHVYDEENTYHPPGLSGRYCRACQKERKKKDVKTHCPKGHAYTAGNIYWQYGGSGLGQNRRCLKCRESTQAKKKYLEAT